MPPKKKIKLIEDEALIFDAEEVTVDQLSDDMIAMSFSYFGPVEIMNLRRVCKKWRGAAKKALVAPVDFRAETVNKHRAMVAMAIALPNLQCVNLLGLNEGNHPMIRGCRLGPNRYSSGEDPFDDSHAEVMHDINIMSNFKKLRSLRLACGVDLNGRYPVLFNFPLLQKLDISGCLHLKWDLDMLRGLPSLKELYCFDVPHMTGDIKSLRVLKDNIEKITIASCRNVKGKLMDLADFPNLRELILKRELIPKRDGYPGRTAVTGDIRNIGENDFPKLKYLRLTSTMIGGENCALTQRISEVPDIMKAIYSCMKRFDIGEWSGRLSSDSPDWYSSYPHENPEIYDYHVPCPPFNISFVKARSRLGWRWCEEEVWPCGRIQIRSCEINWLDPEPERYSSAGNTGESQQYNEEYEIYRTELQCIERDIDLYRGYYQPPTEDEYDRIAQPYIEEFEQRRSYDDD